MSAIPQEREEILAKQAFGHVATIGPDGEPQVNPVWLEWDGQHLKFSQTTERQKVRNLRRNPAVAISVQDPDDPYKYVELRGTVERIEDDDEYTFINKMAKKYLNRDTYPYLQEGEHRVIVHVQPEHATMQ